MMVDRVRGFNRWWIVVGSVLGLVVGNGPMMQFPFAVFLKPVSASFGAERGTLSLAILAGLGLTGIATPFVGALIDRFGVRRVVLPLITLFALSFVLLAYAQSPLAFIAIYGAMGIVAAGQTPLPYAKAIAAAFDRQRGLALGIAMAGVGLGTVIMPQVAQALIARYDWRVAFMVMGAILFVVAVPVVAGLIRDPVKEADGPAVSGSLDGWTGRQTLRTPTFWLFVYAFFVLAIGTNGVIAHIAAILTDRGVSPQTAATALSITGLALIVGRLVAGYLLDRVFAPYVAVVFFILPIIGMGMLVLNLPPGLAMAATVFIGLGLGAEVDMMAFLISRYFGMKSFGQIYGYMFAVFMLGSGVGPAIMGKAFDWSGSYTIALVAMGAAVLIAGGLLLRLGPYPFAGHSASAAPADHGPKLRVV